MSVREVFCGGDIENVLVAISRFLAGAPLGHL